MIIRPSVDQGLQLYKIVLSPLNKYFINLRGLFGGKCRGPHNSTLPDPTIFFKYSKKLSGDSKQLLFYERF